MTDRRYWVWKSVVVAVIATVAVATTVAFALQASTQVVRVEIQAGGLKGIRPNGSTVYFQLRVLAEGADASALVGNGRHIGSAGNQNYWPATGFISGSVVTLGGVITKSPNPNLVGVSVLVSGDSSTGKITLSMGPLPPGEPYNGATIVAEGSGRVVIKGTAVID